MRYQINDQIITLTQGQFQCGEQTTDINDKTFTALKLFLTSGQNIISKDLLLETVWQDIIVSDASIFKQVQTIRTLFMQAGLPEDTIENVYGKGYRLKYAAEAMQQGSSEQLSNSSQTHRQKWLMPVLTFILILTAILSWYYWDQINPGNNKINAAQKSAILDISKNDWQQGLDHINGLLEANQINYSKADLAYLHHQKGQAEQNLQLIDESLATLNHSLQLYEELNDQKMIGDTHLLLARLYDYIDNKDQQLLHINTAIYMFKAVADNNAEIDAYLELAYLQKKAGDIDEAITTYETAIKRAQANGDKTGEMMGINNLAATYLIINNNQQALALAEQGLAINLELGNGQHIANSYSFLSQLKQQLGHTSQALQMIEQALKFQLKTKNHRALSPKLMTLNYLLLETYQHQQLNELLALTAAYASSMNMQGGMAIISLYQGIDSAYIESWDAAEKSLNEAWQIATSKNFNYKRPLTMAFLALANSKNNNHLKAIELANQVLAEAKVSARERNLAHITLAISYTAMENTTLAEKWINLANESADSQWLFDHLTWLKFKLSQLPIDDINQHNALVQQIKEIEHSMTALAENSQMDQEIFEQLKSQVQSLIEQKTT